MKYVLALLFISASTVQASDCGKPVKKGCSEPVKTCSQPVKKTCSQPVVKTTCCKVRTVKIKDPCKVAPCSVATEITVCDPYTCKNVKLTVCLPKNGCLKKSTSRSGRKVTYDYGKYEVEIHFRKSGITIDYDS